MVHQTDPESAAAGTAAPRQNRFSIATAACACLYTTFVKVPWRALGNVAQAIRHDRRELENTRAEEEVNDQINAQINWQKKGVKRGYQPLPKTKPVEPERGGQQGFAVDQTPKKKTRKLVQKFGTLPPGVNPQPLEQLAQQQKKNRPVQSAVLKDDGEDTKLEQHQPPQSLHESHEGEEVKVERESFTDDLSDVDEDDTHLFFEGIREQGGGPPGPRL